MDESRSKSLCWNEDTSYALGLYRLIGRSLGIWPLTCHEFSSKVIFVIAIILQCNSKQPRVSKSAKRVNPVRPHSQDPYICPVGKQTTPSLLIAPNKIVAAINTTNREEKSSIDSSYSTISRLQASDIFCHFTIKLKLSYGVVSRCAVLNVAYNLIREFTSGCIHISNATDFLALLAADISCMLKTSVIRIHWKDMYRIVDSAVKDWSIDRDEMSREIMYKYAYRGRLISVIPLSMALLSLVPMFLYSPPSLRITVHDGLEMNNMSIIEMRNLPMGTGCSVIHLPNFLYLAFYIYQCIQLVCMCFCNLGCDAVFFGLSIHLCAQLKLLWIDIARLGEHHAKAGNGEEIRASIERHNHLLRLLNLVEDIFNVIIFGLLAATGSHIILLGIEILFSLRDGAFMTVVYSSIAITCLLIQLYTYCFMGDYLASHAEDLRTAAYSCTWYNFPSSLTRDVMFVIMKSSKTYHLTAGKVVRINMESFTSIIKTMASFFSFMKLTVVK